MPRVVHFDIAAKDPEKAIAFYSKVFGWKFSTWGGPMEYWLIATGDEKEPGIHGGMSKGEPDKARVLTIGVPNLDATLKQITAAGGKIVMQRSPIAGVGWIAAFQDTTGNELSVMQSDPAAK